MISTAITRFNSFVLSQRDVTKIAIGICLLTVCANIHIPIQPVPITLHTAAVFFIALLYTPQNAFLTVFSYIVLMAMGAPISTGFMGGIGKIIGPSGGFLVAMPLAAFVVSYLQKEIFQDKWYMMAFNTLLGTSLIYGIGVTWLAYVLGSVEKGVTLGLAPFILPGIVKAMILSLAVYGIKSNLNKNQ